MLLLASAVCAPPDPVIGLTPPPAAELPLSGPLQFSLFSPGGPGSATLARVSL